MASTILIVDDDSSIVFLLKEDLQAEGYEVVEGYDGETALRLAAERRPDLIIMDLNMPVVDGEQALRRLREDPQSRQVPVIFLSGEATLDKFPGLRAAAGVTHATKPVDLDELNRLVRRLLGA